jgi:hypothetical protein
VEVGEGGFGGCGIDEHTAAGLGIVSVPSFPAIAEFRNYPAQSQPSAQAFDLSVDLVVFTHVCATLSCISAPYNPPASVTSANPCSRTRRSFSEHYTDLSTILLALTPSFFEDDAAGGQ